MSKLICCSVYDVKAEVFCTPFYSRNKASAVASFQAACMETGSMINIFPEDYELWIVGEWDDHLGEFDGSFNREFVCRGSAFIKE